MEINEIFEKIKSISVPKTNYIVFWAENKQCLFGKDCEGKVVFLLPSHSTKMLPLCQETKSLRFAFNKKCSFELDDRTDTKVMHILTCKENDEDKLLAFIRLTYAFSVTEIENDQYYLAKLFSALSALFDKNQDVSEKELQGLFAELYFILFLKSKGCDISHNWQTKNKMKFDFSLTEKKRIEVKSTLKTSRVHHFKHEQLLSQLFDIKVISIMLQKNDCGISLATVIDKIRKEFSNNYALLIHIENLVSRLDKEKINNIKYDKTYLESNLKFFDAVNIPHFNERTPDGVFNVEYDCTLEGVKDLSEKELINWIGDNNVQNL